jgi:hypothetical protein
MAVPAIQSRELNDRYVGERRRANRPYGGSSNGRHCAMPATSASCTAMMRGARRVSRWTPIQISRVSGLPASYLDAGRRLVVGARFNF